jgi:hypothetical protein
LSKFLDAPKDQSVAAAMEMLYTIQAIDKNEDLTGKTGFHLFRRHSFMVNVLFSAWSTLGPAAFGRSLGEAAHLWQRFGLFGSDLDHCSLHGTALLYIYSPEPLMFLVGIQVYLLESL